MRWHIEVTDTFGGEANYSWVIRFYTEIPDTASANAEVRALLRAMRQHTDAGALFLPPGNVRSECYGDQITFRPRGRCVVAFATPQWSM